MGAANEEAVAVRSAASHTSLKRGNWGSKLEFILTCIGFAIGLGNLWRFPMLAYDNGGGAFLVTYVCASVLFGLPMLFLEFAIGQYTHSGPSRVFVKYAPAFQGMGWGMTVMVTAVGVFYNVIIAWSVFYMWIVLIGKWRYFATCSNPWNTYYCRSIVESRECAEANASLPVWHNFTCISEAENYALISSWKERLDLQPISAAEEFFYNYVLLKTDTMDGLGHFNWRIAIVLALMWTITALCLLYGIKWMGKVSYITATMPYILIFVLFIRAVTLKVECSDLRFQVNKAGATAFQTWITAASQICFSTSIGLGTLLTFASYNELHHNSYRDALIVIVGDSFMSFLGGLTIFCTLGFLADQLGTSLDKVVQGSTGLAFVAYPEALGQMPLPWLWSFLFFFVIFLLGMSSQTGLTEVLLTSLHDEFPPLRRYKPFVAIAACFGCFCPGLIFCTEVGLAVPKRISQSGFFYFHIFSSFVGSSALVIFTFLELIVVILIYGMGFL